MAPPQFGDLKSELGVGKLNEHMASHSYVTGYNLTQDDLIICSQLVSCPSHKTPHAARWYRHVMYFDKKEQITWPKGQLIATIPIDNNKDQKVSKEFDLFGEETEEDREAAKKLAEKKKAGASSKKEIVNRSSLVIDVKPYSIDTDLDMVQKLVREIEMEGLTWNVASKKEPVAFGLFKLRMTCTIVDDLVNTNDLTDRIEALGISEEKAAQRKAQMEGGAEDSEEEEEEEIEGLVQSADIVSFSKI